MFRPSIFVRIILIVLLCGLLFAGGMALFRAGWMQGYQAGALTAASAAQNQNGATMPAAPFYGYPWAHFGPGYGYGFPGMIFPAFHLFGFLLLMFFLLLGAHAFARRRYWAGYGRGPWDRNEPPSPEKNRGETAHSGGSEEKRATPPEA